MSSSDACVDNGPGGALDTLHAYPALSAALRAATPAIRCSRTIDTQGRVTFIRQRPPVRQQDAQWSTGVRCGTGFGCGGESKRGEENLDILTPPPTNMEESQ